MKTRIYVPLDSAAIALGADGVANAIIEEARTRNAAIELVRNGSRGAVWAEPLVEIETPSGRVGYGSVNARDVKGLFDAGFLIGGEHEKNLGLIEELPWFQKQERVIFARCGRTDPLSIDDYRHHGGWRGLEAALALSCDNLVETIMTSGLRGRGGAGFPAGIKWRTVAGAKGAQKYVVCNADEGDSGTFADRMIMEGDPYLLIEGMIIAGLAVGAREGIVYLRSEYPQTIKIFSQAITHAEETGYLGADILGSGKAFKLKLFVGAGAYICGEETALLESLEGKRGQVRSKPPLPALEGLFNQPTLIHNVISLCSVPDIIVRGGEWYQALGMGKSTGTMPFQLAGNIAKGGLVECPFGISLRDLIEGFGEGTRSGRPMRAVQVGGPLGAYLPQSLLDLPTDYETFKQHDAGLGHGGIVVFDDTADLLEQARYAFEFCAFESCGKCTPCRIGSVRGMEVIDKIATGIEVENNQRLLEDLCEVMVDGSLCAMGGMTPIPVLSALQHFSEDFAKRQITSDAAE